ncbi:uncharacterized protein LOC111302615 [Durio zibethinus]|uniref:Uncharacterized protein LOC111302615 n=1 Tax=Durio zibethinus TaxID=66656 RepID=A0A6P5ZMP8_DURZI|nr:uncharacterized protein LOC111302615 [Durio zibethinus]
MPQNSTQQRLRIPNILRLNLEFPFSLIVEASSFYLTSLVSGASNVQTLTHPGSCKSLVIGDKEHIGVLPWRNIERRNLAEGSEGDNSSLILAEKRTNRIDPLMILRSIQVAGISAMNTIGLGGCVVLYTGQGKFHGSTINTLDYAVNKADATAENLRNVSDYLSAAKKITVNSVFLSPDVQKSIDDVVKKINSSASTLSTQTGNNKDKIQHGLDGM